jgi:hypothetical protein
MFILFNFRVDTFEHRHTQNFQLNLKSSLCSKNLPIAFQLSSGLPTIQRCDI